MKIKACLRLFLPLLLFALAACKPIGPPTIPRDRFDYSRAIADSWKQQTLLNIVKTRYIDLPIFLDVASVVSGYQWETTGSVGGTVSSDNAVQGNFLNLGAQGRYTDRPTITYFPKTGDKFLEGMIKPFPPAAIFQMLQAGYAADFIFEMCLDTICGRRNRPAHPGFETQGRSGILRGVAAAAGDPGRRRIRDAGGDGQGWPAGHRGVFPPGRCGPGTGGEKRPDPGAAAAAPRGPDVPAGDFAGAGPGRRTDGVHPVAAPDHDGDVAGASMFRRPTGSASSPPHSRMSRERAPMLQVHSGPEKPADSFAAVPYEGAWFWIAADDWRSKRTFVALMFLFTMIGTQDQDRAPVLTIPTQ